MLHGRDEYWDTYVCPMCSSEDLKSIRTDAYRDRTNELTQLQAWFPILVAAFGLFAFLAVLRILTR